MLVSAQWLKGVRTHFAAHAVALFAPARCDAAYTHAARFSPDDKFSRHRITLKKRFGLLLTSQPRPTL